MELLNKYSSLQVNYTKIYNLKINKFIIINLNYRLIISNLLLYSLYP